MAEIEIDTGQGGEDCDYVVCTPVTDPLAFADNMVAYCCKCGQLVQHRPHAPKRPDKVCLPCITPQMERENKEGNLHITITPKTAMEVAAFLAKKKAH